MQTEFQRLAIAKLSEMFTKYELSSNLKEQVGPLYEGEKMWVWDIPTHRLRIWIYDDGADVSHEGKMIARLEKEDFCAEERLIDQLSEYVQTALTKSQNNGVRPWK